MIYINLKMLVLLKNYLNQLKDFIFESFFEEYNRHFFKYFFSRHIMMKTLSLVEENTIKDIRNNFRLKKN